MPLSIVILLALLGLLFLWAGRHRSSLVCLGLGLSVLWIGSMPITAGTLYGKLEQSFPPVPASDIPVGDCIIVLGGAVGAAMAPRVDIELNDAVDRVYKAAQLYRAGKGQAVIVAAGNQPWDRSLTSEGQLIKALLTEWGVPESAIAVDGASRNTRENAVNSKKLIAQMGCEAPLLVTSAAHMPRSVAAFQQVGVSVFPVSTDVHVLNRLGFTAFDFLPQAGALAMTSDALREWIGRKVYQLRGWN